MSSNFQPYWSTGIIGEVYGFNPRSEVMSQLNTNMPSGQVWTFRVMNARDLHGNPVPPFQVEIRGLQMTGYINQGDIIQVKEDHKRGGTLNTDRVYNLTTNTEVGAKNPRLGKSIKFLATGIGIIILIGFALFAIYGFNPFVSFLTQEKVDLGQALNGSHLLPQQQPQQNKNPTNPANKILTSNIADPSRNSGSTSSIVNGNNQDTTLNTQIYIKHEPDPVNTGETERIDLGLMENGNYHLPNIKMQALITKPDGSHSKLSCVTDKNGLCTVNYHVPNKIGIYSISASTNKENIDNTIISFKANKN
jgi:hypothetical protein